MRVSALRVIALLMLPSVILMGCGGGGGGSSDASGTAEGLWFGTTSQSRTVAGLVLSDGSYWFLYTAINDPTIIGGLVQGNGSSGDSQFQSSNTKDFNLEIPAITDGNLSGNYAQRQTLDGTVAADVGGGSVTFNLDYDPAYQLVPTLNLVAGTYSGWAATAAGIDIGATTIAGNGVVTPVGAGGCQYTGTVTPRSDGNAYNVSVTFAGGVCSNGTSTVSGVAYLSPDGTVLYLAALNNSRTNGFIAIGTRQQ